VLRDIRELKDDPAAYAAELRRRWTGLPLWQAFGASRRDDGHWVLPELSFELASPVARPDPSALTGKRSTGPSAELASG
jgi:hypothetical protein